MIINFPHMGYLSAPLSAMLRNLQIDFIEAPPITKKTIQLGELHSPESVCLPYKINLGNFLESLEQGANTFVMACGAGKCRLGFYHAVQKLTLEQKRDIQFFTINTENLFSDLYRFLKLAAPKAGAFQITKNILMVIQKLNAIDAIFKVRNRIAPRSTSPAAVISLSESGIAAVANSATFRQIKELRRKTIDCMCSLSKPETPAPPKVGLIGEFYVLLEPSVNYSIEKELILQGIEVERFVNLGDWTYAKAIKQTLGLYNEEEEYARFAKPYANFHVGGDGLKTVGTATLCAKQGYTGLVHLYPFGCMPEIVAQYPLKNVAADYDLPILSLSLDTHSSDVGVNTRIEAFADCIKRKAAAQHNTASPVYS